MMLLSSSAHVFVSVTTTSLLLLSTIVMRSATAATTTTAFVPSSPFHPITYSAAGAAPRIRLSVRDNNKPKFVKNINKTKQKTKRSKPNSRKMIDRRRSTHHSSGQPRPVLTDYEANRNHFVNKQRLFKNDLNCEHFGLCSGCVVGNNVGNVDIVQSAKLFFSSTAIRKRRADVIHPYDDDDDDDDDDGLAVEWVVEEKDDGFYKLVVPSNVTQWRTQAKLAVAPKSSGGWAKDGCQFGLYQRGTHDVLSIPHCAVHHPSINRAVEALVKATEKVGTPAFLENSREGGLRYVQLQVERATGRICLTLVWNAETLKETQPSLSRLVKELNKQEPDLWHSIWCNCNDGLGNNIFSRSLRRWHRLSGPEFIREPLPVGDQGWLYFSPLTFRQGNMDGFDILAIDVAREVPAGSKVCELYAGVGLLGLTALAYHAVGEPLEWVRCSDENPANPKSFKRTVESLPPNMTGRRQGKFQTKDEDDSDGEGLTLRELAALMESGKPLPEKQRKQQEKTSYVVASAGKALRAGQALGAQVMIVDPPRKGLEDDVLDELCKPFNPDQPYVDSASLLTMADEKVNWANDIQTLIYVSCGFDALARDCERLLSSQGDWVLERATGYILFPGSDHVETLCIFKRK